MSTSRRVPLCVSGVGDYWTPCLICETCVELFIKDMMPTYLKNLLEADCRASQLRVLAQGPPIYVKVGFIGVA